MEGVCDIVELHKQGYIKDSVMIINSVFEILWFYVYSVAVRIDDKYVIMPKYWQCKCLFF